ncbi:sushi, von Willebrand factor type A, EGF and pentraxin domain-containing protein 1-like [Tubulanus polymorphus]|uniref:sushi, von Willebrand factor type A, EGF and pentraxin domain-containing protein 1-like n=1 Tax=Tubulanus polymorphus TaxID=672921 RepID=UPI003DA67679
MNMMMNSIQTLCIFLLFATRLTHALQQERSEYYGEDTSLCFRDPEATSKRECRKKCDTDADCHGKKKRCICDGICGLSCVNPLVRCESLDQIKNGKITITPFNKMGAVAKYSCEQGFILMGGTERYCQGDGKWSGKMPSCEGDYYCGPPPDVPNAMHDSKQSSRYIIGTRLHYTCNEGFYGDGFHQAMCIGEGKWVGPKLTCLPRSCGHPGDVDNGRRVGDIFSYPYRVVYFCDTGYIISGHNFRECQENGKWSGSTPICKAIQCSKPQPPINGKVVGKLFTYNSVISYNCNPGYRLVGDKQRRCTEDGVWDGKDPFCQLIECPIPDPLWNGIIEGDQTTYGSIIIFRCNPGTLRVGESLSATCLDNGKWSHPTPHCHRPCQVPYISNGEVLNYAPGSSVEHGVRVTFTCRRGHRLNVTDTSWCSNGTWTVVPHCGPSPCKERPPLILNGLVRYHKLRHGHRAKYSCNTGYKLVGSAILTCQFGKWAGNKPYCEPSYCPYPGTIENGKILLVGVIGKYEYRIYVERIGQGEVIEFQCKKGYKRIGPAGATCIDGVWSPDNRPLCQKGKHLRLIRTWQRTWRKVGKRRKRRSLASNYPAMMFNKYRALQASINANEAQTRSFNGRKLLSTADENVHCPAFEEDGMTINIVTGYKDYMRYPVTYTHGTILKVICDETYDLEPQSNHFTCVSGDWKPDIPHCQARYCKIPDELDHMVIISTPNDISVKNNTNIPNGYKITETCQKGYELNSNYDENACADGKWEQEFPSCVPASCEIPLLENGIYNGFTDDLPKYTFPHGKSLEYSCDPGYDTITSPKIVCIHGQWKDNVPECVKLQNNCKLPEVQYAELSVPDKQVTLAPGAELIISCNLGFAMLGIGKLRCNQNGSWDSSPPTCKPYCRNAESDFSKTKNLRPFLQEKVIYGITELECMIRCRTELKFDCHSADYLHYEKRCVLGKISRLTRPDLWLPALDWTNFERVCVPVGCEKPKFLHNGKITVKGIPYIAGTTLSFKCDEGYRLEGSSSIQCLNTRRWSEAIPACQETNKAQNSSVRNVKNALADCFRPVPNANVVLSYKGVKLEYIQQPNFKHNTILTARCKKIESFVLPGISKVTCYNGVWDSNPNCDEIGVDAIKLKIPNSLTATTVTDDGSILLRPGEKFAIDCVYAADTDKLTWIANDEGNVVKETFISAGEYNAFRLLIGPVSFKDTGSYYCQDDKHRRSVNINVEVTDKIGTFCTEPKKPVFGYITGDKPWHIGSYIIYRCSRGYTMRGNALAYCLNDKMWSSPAPSCEATKCHKSLIKDRSIAMIFNGNSVGSRVTFHCKEPGQILQGSQEAVCNRIGKWRFTGTKMPICKARTCPTLSVPQNYNIIALNRSHSYGDSVLFVCKERNYVLDGPPDITCQMDGTWSAEVPKCIIACANPGAPTHGAIEADHVPRPGNLYPVETILTFRCQKKYRLPDLVSRTSKCLPNGHWSQLTPACVPVLS